MEKCARIFIVTTIIVQLLVTVFGAFINQQNEDKPKADKLTINIDSVSQRIPPQIAYFIPDRMLNRTFDFNQNQPRPPIINMFPPNFPRMNQTFNDFNMTDLMMSQQRAYRYVAVPKDQIQSYVQDDPDTAFQNFNYQIDFAKIPDKQPDFTRFESLNREREHVVKRVKKPKKYIKRPVSTNYANTSPNIRGRIKYIKIDHENKFEVSKDKQHSGGSSGVSGDSGIYSDELENIDTSEQTKVYNNNAKLKKSRRKKPHHYSMIKLSHPTSSVENESSSYNFDNTNTDEIDHFHSDHANHKNCDDHMNSDLTEHQLENESDGNMNFGDVENKVIKKHPKGFAIYLTKVIKHPKPYRIHRMDKTKVPRNGFVPTRIMASVRRVKKIVHKPRKIHKPTMRERLHESGGHVVYTEDGYEDKEYDHGTDDKSLEYLSRSRRSTNFKELKGQELIDHLDSLIRNVSDYLNSSEIIPDTDKKYPLYNISDDSIDDSPIKYSEYAKPVVDEDYSSELYESKTDDCDDVVEQIDLSNAHNETGGPKKRLGNLGNKIDCLKHKYFGKQPLDNPLFQEDQITQPKPDNVFANIMQEADNIQQISEVVHSDVMDNIKFNENQRIFSHYGVSDNFAQPSYNSNPATLKPVNELNTNEKYSDNYKQRNNLNEKKPPVTQSPYTFFNPFKDPAQLPLLDISKFIPTPKYQPTESDAYPLQTDFVPIVSPYGNNYNQPAPTVTLTTTTTTTTSSTTFAPPTQPQPNYVSAIRGQGPMRLVPYYNNQNSNTLRTPAQNILLLKHRRPVAVVRIIPNVGVNHSNVGPRP